MQFKRGKVTLTETAALECSTLVFQFLLVVGRGIAWNEHLN
ncbi:hypothetical protein [Roseovarius pelagicus]|uniref:Uncharacterized protein n=1 Tax=Roseovarius pelagicus TaxID=2980108 RepID=A0ABY6D839_9RHOB|nr:hypothetical protein [Roseovarius pelagicus]UXX82084.1 hypothetical protein N7U68_13320 [Roseovarius pelagicus]